MALKIIFSMLPCSYPCFLYTSSSFDFPTFMHYYFLFRTYSYACVWLISCRFSQLYPFFSPHVTLFYSFKGLNNIPCVYTPHSLYSFSDDRHVNNTMSCQTCDTTVTSTQWFSFHWIILRWSWFVMKWFTSSSLGIPILFPLELY